MVYNNLSLTEIRIIGFFLNNVNNQFTINAVSKQIKTTYKMTYKFMQKLIKEDLIKGEKQGKSTLCKFNYKNANENVFYVEALKTNSVLFKNKDLSILLNDLKAKYHNIFYTLILFGSYAKDMQTKNSDIDLLAIIPKSENIDKNERLINSQLSLSPLKTHLIVVRDNDFTQMLNNKQATNVAKEVINNHIIIKGIENYYDLLKNA